ncbi:MAG: hypothetical protein K2K48_05875 [Anaeroplasmataceae bacterium]|nr:hypothetical protein [Anaeroplasmataceae bacterium]MDE6414924.1 hypothetical protein [Anaeroplasmataceae bacterium]
MKKMKFLVVTLIFFFCYGMKASFQADAAGELIQIYEDEDLDVHSAVVLNCGYYFFGCAGTQIDESSIKGDYDYLYQPEKSYQVDYQMIDEYFNIPDSIDLTVLGEAFCDSFGSMNIYYNGIRIVHVKSYAVFFTDGEVVNLTCFGIQEHAPNTNTSIAGNMTHFVDYDHPSSLSEIKSRYSATDNVDGNITSRIVFETNYDPEHAEIGAYYILLHVSDHAGHITYAADVIRVKDLTPPSIQLTKKEHTVEVNTVFTSADAKKFFTATDNQTSQKYLRWEYKDEYNSQYNKLGTYTITGTVRDNDYNSSSAILTIHVVDTTKPNISLLAGGDTIYADHVLADDEIRALLKVTDNYYSLSNSKIQILENTCTGVQGKEYKLKVSITDGSNNVGEQIFKYYLTDTESPIIMVEKTLYIPLGATYTNEQIIQMLKEAGLISSQSADVSLIIEETIDAKNEGSYQITYIETLQDGSKKEGTVLLNVFSPVAASSDASTQNPSSWYYLLLILPVMVAVILIVLKKKKYEKD